MQDFNLQSTSFKLRGYWNLPGSDEKAAGELVYDEDSLRLVLIGGLNKAVSEHPLAATPSQTTFSIVHGTLVDRTSVTLLNCFYTNLKPDLDWQDFSHPKDVQLLESELHCGIAIIGDHLETDEEVFATGQFEFPQLEEWLGTSPFTANHDKDRNVDIQFRPPSDDCYHLEGFDLSLKHAIRPPSLPLGNSPSAKHTAFFVATPTNSQAVKWFISLNRELSDFLSCLYGGNILGKRLLLKRHASSDYLAIYYARHRTDDKAIEFYNFWTTYEKLRVEFSSLLSSWLTAHDSHKQARRMLLSSERRPSAYMELRFLPLVQALEALTQSKGPTELVSDEEFQVIKKAVRDAIPPGTNSELVGAFMQSLGYANGKSLRYKIEQLIATLSPTITPFLCRDVKDFTKGVVNTRNFYTHYSSQKCILDKRELHWATIKLSLLLRVLLLHAAGMNEDLIQSILERNMKVVNERRSWQEVSEVGTAEGTIGSEE